MLTIMMADLRLFDGAGEGAGAAASGGENASADAAQEGKVQVVYGKQPESAPAQTDETNPAEPDKPEDRAKAYHDLVNSPEYKEEYTKDTQRLINKRFKEMKALEEKLNQQQAVIDAVAQRYNVDAGSTDAVLNALESDDHYYEDAAMEAGMTVDQYREFEKLKRNNERYAVIEAQRKEQERVNSQVREWMSEAEGVKAKYPDFDLESVIAENGGDNTFTRMLKSGVPMEHAYRVLNMDRIVADTTKQTAALTEKAVIDSVRAKGARPAENGTAPRSAFVVKDDVSKLTKQDRAEIARRAMRGEHIEF